MQNTLLLVDGSSYLYRAFHALPDLRSPDGHPTGAMHGMVNMLRRLRADYPAAYIACVFDAKGKTFRDDMYPDYKATRASMPDDLRLQIEPIHEAVKHMGWPILMVEGVEADDVIGTLSVQATQTGHEHHRLDRRQGPGAAGQRQGHADQHDDQREARRSRRAGQVRRAAEPHHRLPDPDRRHRRQHPRRDEVRPEDGAEMAGGARQPGRRDAERRTRSPARSARTCARRSNGCRKGAS